MPSPTSISVVVDAWRIRRSMTGKDRQFVDEFFYDFDHKPRSMGERHPSIDSLRSP